MLVLHPENRLHVYIACFKSQKSFLIQAVVSLFTYHNWCQTLHILRKKLCLTFSMLKITQEIILNPWVIHGSGFTWISSHFPTNSDDIY